MLPIEKDRSPIKSYILRSHIEVVPKPGERFLGRIRKIKDGQMNTIEHIIGGKVVKEVNTNIINVYILVG